MALENISVEEFYPVIRQTLIDVYGIDSFFMRAPYSDFERLDLGLRKMVWGTYKTNAPVFSLSEESPYSMVVLESSLGFYNLIATLSSDEKPDIICLMPFRTESISATGVNKIMKDNHILPEHADEMLRIYTSLPVINMEELIITLAHLIEAVLPDFENFHTELINYNSEKHDEKPSEERYHEFSSDILEESLKRIEACSNAIVAGNSAKAVEQMKSVIDYTSAFRRGPLVQIKHELHLLDAFISSRMLQTSVHPKRVIDLAREFEIRIRDSHSESQLFHMPFDMARKFAILAKNYTYDGYSYLIRNVVNYIDQHLAHELSLAILAEEFDKNASYLSNAFKKETGETITNYISKQRIQASLRYFNTTDLSVADIAGLVGIPDFGYFSKQFKKYVGVSPRDYKKMLDK